MSMRKAHPAAPRHKAAELGSSAVASERRHALVPVDTAANRALVAVIAVLTFLAALAAGGAEIVAQSSQDWRGSIAREATIQIRPMPGRNLQADLDAAGAMALLVPGIAAVQTVSKADSEDLLEPWLGRGLDLSDLPVPRLLVLKLDAMRRPNLSGLAARLAERVPGAILDDHGAWLTRLTRMADTVVYVAFGLVLLVLGAAGAAVAFATRGAMAGNREMVDVLHIVGAGDGFIARQFQGLFIRLGLKGGLLGALGACLFVGVFGAVSNSAFDGASAAELRALFGSFGMSWRGYALIAGVALLVAAIAGVVSGRSVRRYLSET